MKKTRKKLTLNRETIGNLTKDQLSEAAGGGGLLSGVTVCNSCITLCNCPSQQNTICNTGCIACQTQTGCIGTERGC